MKKFRIITCLVIVQVTGLAFINSNAKHHGTKKQSLRSLAMTTTLFLAEYITLRVSGHSSYYIKINTHAGQSL